MAQTADSQPSQTSHAESEQTISAKLPTQLNTPNRFVPDLIRVFPKRPTVRPVCYCLKYTCRQRAALPVTLMTASRERHIMDKFLQNFYLFFCLFLKQHDISTLILHSLCSLLDHCYSVLLWGRPSTWKHFCV